ncbi:nitroreductase family protein [Jeongeupia chitinilytica]|uniref:Nitroreductase domain-containing protein n=1 Tax=Jeongeupia chitinilytica TaxID=1041641 RepID=A0ABQ3GWX5_9NEIS|nr:nitroreductase family protein [Jeongeupia chitinilytica]GHD56389.1 hypothetical protein GCM10007350_03390 [Jeongeupia chitinilytica]
MLKQWIKRGAGLFPASVETAMRRRYRALRDDRALGRAIRADLKRYRQASGLLQPGRRQVLQAHIIKSYHRVEKALALPDPRPGFGEHAVQLLLGEVDDYLTHYGADHCVAGALNTLDEYLAFNTSKGVDVSVVRGRVDALRSRSGLAANPAHGGTRLTSRSEILAAIPVGMDAFFAHRFSVRQFAERTVAPELLTEAIVMAQKTPSVCNRESGHVFVVKDKARIAELLAFQNGNRGFGHQADTLLVVASRLPCFHTVGERYQHWIDGGMYAMSLVYALHALGLGSCCLNWSVEPHEDAAFKQAAGIADDYTVIMLLAVGHLPEHDFKVAQSPRRPIAEVMSVL